MNVLDLFSGIGGMALGFQQVGFQPVAFCERHPFARAILARAWPTIPCYPDICLLSAQTLQDDGVPHPEIL